MVFVCQQCGECCSIMGEVLCVHEEYGEDRFLLLNRYTGEKTQVTIDPDKRSLYSDAESSPAGCPFLRFDRNKKAYCTVHMTRPDMCRDFGCWRLLILDHSGKRVGRVMQQRFFAPEDSTLALLWEASIRDIDEIDNERWDEAVVRILTRKGYRVVR